MSTITVNRPSSTIARSLTAPRSVEPRSVELVETHPRSVELVETHPRSVELVETHPRSVELVETSRSTPSAPIRLTRRGRWVVTLLLLGAVLALSLAFGSGSVATDDRGSSPATTTVVVSEGASLWSIADEIAGPGQTREVMYDIERLNGLESSTLVPGQTLVVPAG